MLEKSIIKFLKAFFYFFKRPKVRNFLTYLFFVLSTISCFLTYLLFTDVELYSKSSKKVISILYCDIAFILILLLLSSHKIAELWTNRHKKGSRITLRLILLFSLTSVIPSVLMSFFSAFFFHNGIDSWFNERNKTVLQESLNVAESYLKEHKKRTLNDCIAISKTIEYHIDRLEDLSEIDNSRFSRDIGFLLDDLCALKNINSAILLNNSFNVIAHSKYSTALHFLNINNKDFQRTNEKNAIILEIANSDNDGIIAISCFKNENNEYMYLIVEKNVDSNILYQAKNARTAYNEYHSLLQNRESLEIAFVFMFLVVGILLLVASIVVAIIYSWKIVNPISNLIDVSENIIGGNLKARAKQVSSYEELSILTKTFNQMVDQVHKQREDLVKINKSLDERIKFSSSVLAGVSSGVIGIDNNAIYIWNTAAERLLNKQITFGENIFNIIPELKKLLEELQNNLPFIEKEIQYKKNYETCVFLVKIENIAVSNSYYSRFVITFDDLTNMIAAQRKAAWSDVARRVAHEIKNPLTPIQLSAERIHRKYISQISADKGTFSQLIDVIIRQVGDIKRLIDDFTFFAKLPEPIFRECDVHEICKQAIFLMQNASADIEIRLNSEKANYEIKADERLLHQCIMNLIQNAINALNTINKKDKKVAVSLKIENHNIYIDIEDNGPGLPKEKIESLATPYFTMMPKGTGLGLAIVKKIIQDHNGDLLFDDSKYGGAKVTISIPCKQI